MGTLATRARIGLRRRRRAAVGLPAAVATVVGWYATSPTGLPARMTLGRRPGLCVPLAFSPDGRTLATTDRDGVLTLWDVGGE